MPCRPAGDSVLFFFFQAEDGIRVGHVTGVQTCALPISRCRVFMRKSSDTHEDSATGASAKDPPETLGSLVAGANVFVLFRSEERRVGKECMFRAAAAAAECNGREASVFLEIGTS